jgi:two-component system OmpR family sensor kinase
VKLATRLTILLACLTTVVALSVGMYAVNLSTRSQYATLDGTINAVVDSGLGHPNTALSDALNAVQQQSYNLTLDVIDPSNTVTQINSPPGALRRPPTLADARNSLNRVGTSANLPGYRIRSLDVGGGDYLLVAGSTSQIARQNRRLVLDVALAGLLAALVVMVLARLLMRRDLQTMERLIGYASDVAKGVESGPIPPGLGSRDVRELQAALATMVAALRQRIATETKSVETMQQFIGDASHELRTPLTVIKGYNELLAGPSVSEVQQVRALERVQREIERMEALVTDLLLLTEVREVPQSGNERVALSSLLTTHVVEFALENRGRAVTNDIEPDHFVRARNDFVDRLIINAFNNIVRHTREDVAVSVTLHRRGSELEMRIEDGGEGLPEYGLRPLRFGRHDSSRSRETGGSGLGMSIMYDIAEALHGSMTTEHSPLGGLALVFVFPCSD